MKTTSVKLSRLWRIASLLLVVLLVGCKNVDYNKPQLADIPIFKDYIAKNITSVSRDPYFTSTYRPGDTWYKILDYLQHGRHDLAAKLLEPLAKAKDPDAMFWLAKMRFRSSIENIEPAYNYYVAAANLGQPYAALALDPSDFFCTRYFGSDCNKKWGELATKLFTERAKKGDLRAQYYLLQREPLENQEQRNTYLKKLMDFSEQGYFQPLYNYINKIQKKDKNHVLPELNALAVELLKVGANFNFIPAITYLMNNSNKITSSDINEIEYLKKGASLGSMSALGYRFFKEFKGKLQGNKELTALMIEELTGDDSYRGILYSPIKYSNLPPSELAIERAKMDKKVEVARKKVKGEMAKMNKMLYLDGFTDRSYWTRW